MSKKVLVSGCFDVLHSGHIAFLQEAASHGELYISIGSDTTIEALKNRPTMYKEAERKYMLEALRCVKEVHIGPGCGLFDFEPLLDTIKPDIFFVNADGSSDAKRELIQGKGIIYLESERIPHGQLTARSTTDIRAQLQQ